MKSLQAYQYLSQQIPQQSLNLVLALLFLAVICLIAIFCTMLYTRLEHRRMHEAWKNERDAAAASTKRLQRFMEQTGYNQHVQD